MNCPKCKYFMRRYKREIGVDSSGMPLIQVFDYCDRCGISIDVESKSRINNPSSAPNQAIASYEKESNDNKDRSRMISLKCEDCHGIMEVDKDREVVTCPYCGSKKLLVESENIRIEKIRNNASVDKFKTIENIIKARQEYKLEQMRMSQEFSGSLIPVILILLLIMIFMLVKISTI